MSAMLTYFGLIVTQSHACDERIVPADRLRTVDCAERASALSWCGRNISGLGPRRKSGNDGRRNAADAGQPGPSVRGGNAMAVPFDQRRRLHLVSTASSCPGRDAKMHVLTHGLHYASCVFEGERAYGGEIFKCTEHSERLQALGAACSTSRFPIRSPRSTPPSAWCSRRTARRTPMCAPVAWRGSEMMGVSAQNNTIHLAIATWDWPSYFDPAQRLKGIRLDLAEYRRPDPATAPCARQGRRPLHDLHHLQAPRRAQRLCRRHDARLAGPRRRMHRRQHLLHQGRQDPHADRRLLPRRHHPRAP